MDDAQVEQDLVISRALVDIFSHPTLRDGLAFRGGTALFKLHLPAARYSEDIDLVQVRAEPAGPVMAALHDVLNPWLGQPRVQQTHGRIVYRYRFQSEDEQPLRLKVEINTREHFTVGGLDELPFAVRSRWFDGDCSILSYGLNELLGTKLRALYQRRKGRDLFDLAIGLAHDDADAEKIVTAFNAYMDQGGYSVTRRQFEENLAAKLDDQRFASDIGPLLATGFDWDISAMSAIVGESLISRLPD